jgi:hypothetical protein
MKEKIPSIEQKTPIDTQEQFKLPPSRKNKEEMIRKENVTYPTSHGTIEKREKQTSNMNKHPPVDHTQDRKESLFPSNKGLIPKSKRKSDIVNRKIPKQVKTKRDHDNVPPTRRGIAEKKPKRIINKLPHQSVRNKIPKKKFTSPPSTIGMKQKNEKTVRSKKPPKYDTESSPMKPKSIPPTVIKSKIPKININKKKPQ